MDKEITTINTTISLTMKKILIILLSIICLTACDKMDTNGALDGNWQLTEWKDADGNIIADNHSGIYWTIKLNLIQIRQIYKSVNYLSYFSHTGDNLILTEVHITPLDELVQLPDSAIAHDYGVTGKGQFAIKRLTNDNLILENDEYTFNFRKW